MTATLELDIDLTHDQASATTIAPAALRVEAVTVTVTPKARCADGNGTLTHLFFSDIPLNISRAKAICSKCTMSASCLEGAIERQEPWGVWGGELIDSGRVIVNKRPRGRPPKHPRPVVVIDEVPIPPHLVA